MRGKQILEKAIDKVLKNIFTTNLDFFKDYRFYKSARHLVEFYWQVEPESYRINTKMIKPDGVFVKSYSLEEIIFSHSFAKAFWGVPWKYNIQQMVLEKEPLKYIERFLGITENKDIKKEETPKRETGLMETPAVAVLRKRQAEIDNKDNKEKV